MKITAENDGVAPTLNFQDRTVTYDLGNENILLTWYDE